MNKQKSLPSLPLAPTRAHFVPSSSLAMAAVSAAIGMAMLAGVLALFAMATAA